MSKVICDIETRYTARYEYERIDTARRGTFLKTTFDIRVYYITAFRSNYTVYSYNVWLGFFKKRYGLLRGVLQNY